MSAPAIMAIKSPGAVDFSFFCSTLLRACTNWSEFSCAVVFSSAAGIAVSGFGIRLFPVRFPIPSPSRCQSSERRAAWPGLFLWVVLKIVIRPASTHLPFSGFLPKVLCQGHFFLIKFVQLTGKARHSDTPAAQWAALRLARGGDPGS